MTKHIYKEYNCQEGTYQYCGGGLAFCTVCKGAEGSLTTDCCGRPITEEEEYKIYNLGILDFRDGKWVNKPNYRRVVRKESLKEGDFVMIIPDNDSFSVYEVIKNDFTGELYLDNNFGQIKVSECADLLWNATRQEWAEFNDG